MPQWFGGSALNNFLVPEDRQWAQQWRRLQRWHQRVLKLKQKSLKEELTEEDHDTILAFFHNCYHMRDWISSARPELKDKVKKLFENNEELRVCRDICNGYKHKDLSNASHDPDFNIYREYDHFVCKLKPTQSPVKYRIAYEIFEGSDVKKHDLFKFAEKCFDVWNSFINAELSLGEEA